MALKFCIIIPVYNEAENIAALVSQIKAVGYSLVVIDDGSGDHSGQRAREAGAEVITHPQRQGKGMSLRTGFSYALDHHFDAVITMDGDGQHAVEDIPVMLQKAETSPESVITGNRMHDVREMPFLRKITNRLMSWVISLIAKTDIPDTQCGFRYVSCQILKDIQLECKDYEIESEVLIKASKKGFSIHSVPIKTIYNNETSDIKPFWDTIRFLKYIWRETFSR
jgi:glycosyltransferase involved in cell wall biosynthesis